MKETRLKRLIKKMMDCVFLDAMNPEFKAANAELLKAIKMNDKSGAIPHADLEAINKAMKANDSEKAGQALKKVQLQLSKAEKTLDDEVKDVNARLADAKQAGEITKQELKAKKALEAVFEKAKSVCDSVKSNPKNASKLTALTDKLRDYGDLSKRASQVVTLSASGKDVSKQVDMLRKSIDTAEKKYKKDLANTEKEAKKAKDALEVMAMRQKVTQGKQDAFQKERLYLAKVIKELGEGAINQDIPGREQKTRNENLEKQKKAEAELKDYVYKIGNAGILARGELDKRLASMHKNKTAPGDSEEWFVALLTEVLRKYKEHAGDEPNYIMTENIARINNMISSITKNGDIIRYRSAKRKMEEMARENEILKNLFIPPLNFIDWMEVERSLLSRSKYNGFSYYTASNLTPTKRPLVAASEVIRVDPNAEAKVKALLKEMDGIELSSFLSNLRDNSFRAF